MTGIVLLEAQAPRRRERTKTSAAARPDFTMGFGVLLRRASMGSPVSSSLYLGLRVCPDCLLPDVCRNGTSSVSFFLGFV